MISGLLLLGVMTVVWLVSVLAAPHQSAARGALFLTTMQAADITLIEPHHHFPPSHLDESAWRTIALPRSWPADAMQPQGSTVAWYRMPLPEQASLSDWRHLLILRHMMNLEVWLDGYYLGGAGSVAPGSLQRNWNRPVTWSLPEALVTGDRQMLYFRLHSAPDFGVMSPVMLGDKNTIMSRFRLNHFLQIDVVKVSLIAMLLIASLGLLVWIRLRQRHWLLISVMSLSWALPLLYILLPSVPVPLADEFDFLRLSHWGTVAGALSLLAFIYSYYLHLDTRRLGALVGVAVIHGVMLASVPDGHVVLTGSIGQAVAQLLFVMLIIKLLRQKTLRNAEVYSIIAGLVIMLLAAAHDVSLANSNSMERWRWDMFISYITQPVMLIIVAWHGVRAFLASVTKLSFTNAHLQQRLLVEEEKIRDVFRQQEQVQRESHLAMEREWVYRDLHDDLGARLLSLVLKSDNAETRDLARSALQDLRDMVSRVMHEEQSLVAVLADSLAEIDGRATAFSKRFSWQVDEALDDLTCDHRRLLSLRLLLRELSGLCLRQPGPGALALDLRLAGAERKSPGTDLATLSSGTLLAVQAEHSPLVPGMATDMTQLPTLLLKRIGKLQATARIEAGAHWRITVFIPLFDAKAEAASISFDRDRPLQPV